MAPLGANIASSNPGNLWRPVPSQPGTKVLPLQIASTPGAFVNGCHCPIVLVPLQMSKTDRNYTSVMDYIQNLYK